MRTVVCVLLLLSLAGVPSTTLMSGSASDVAGRQSVSHQAQPPLVRAQTVNRLPSPRDFTLRDASCDFGGREAARLIAGLSSFSGASATATRPRRILRI